MVHLNSIRCAGIGRGQPAIKARWVYTTSVLIFETTGVIKGEKEDGEMERRGSWRNG